MLAQLSHKDWVIWAELKMMLDSNVNPYKEIKHSGNSKHTDKHVRKDELISWYSAIQLEG